MRISSYDPQKLEDAYGILCRAIHSELVDKFMPFGLVFCKVLPSTSTTPHCHHENEAFLIVAGQGQMKIGEELASVHRGDVVFIPAGSTHQLTNTGEGDLDFYSIYWTIAKSNENDASLELIIPAPPTPNGSLHLGHLSGPYLAADVAHRASLMLGRQSLQVMGTDDNQSYVGAKAREKRCRELDIIDEFAPQIFQVIKDFRADVSYFLRPIHNEEYKEFIIQFYADLKKDGLIKLAKRKAVRCVSSNSILYGSAIEGRCPNCGEVTGGNGCENCGYYNDAWDLAEAKSTVGEGEVDYVYVERGYIDLEEHRDFLESFVEKVAMPKVMRCFYRNYLKNKLPCVSVSEPANWGIPAPQEQGNVIYEWCEMAGGYLYLLQKMQKDNDNLDFSNVKVNLAFGFDNAFFYGLLLPVLLKNTEVDLQAFLTNYFLHLDGEKFSTSRNHAIWGRDMLDKIAPDLLRLHLSLIRSELCSTNYRISHFRCFLEDLCKWDELLTYINEANTDFPVDLSGDHKMTETEERFIYYFNQSCAEVISHYNIKSFRLNKAAKHLVDIVEQLHEFYYNGVVDNADNMHILLLALHRFCKLSAPVMPHYATDVAKCFEFDGLWDVATPLHSGTRGKLVKALPTSFVKDTLHSLDQIK
ncbi:class I tRNA ligase family protein [Candidatus Uabimicrobium amorphum]|uniref:Methionine--tRNA ligase n=1 Tax=Uabimicrobium amorphum TaxID=2596890 RepID=A0A5S9ISD1_UABAM|nr:class I tRNA ligase family protein [Candidatus Uabimicrobium amorphum]BBM87263.1 hypothetical protein UABAM_05666 [Candidatus Uabimicrobium amorphum]